jgi:hypothetical protein
MSENQESNEPSMKAGSDIISACPVCGCNFKNKVAEKVNQKCPNPLCQVTFCVIVSD